jgi:DNA (cytosine-5)-methyltransferase 1
VAGTSPAMTAVAVPPLRSIELFAGAGGLAMGVARAGFQPAQVIEWNRWCCDTLRENRARGLAAIAHWPDPTEGDVRGVDFRAHEGRVDLVTGGPPCQPFSLGGRHRAHLDARDMWPQAVRALREAKPRAFIFENVKGLTRESFASYLSYIVLQLSHPERVGRANEHWAAHLGRLERHHLGEKRREFGYRVVYRVLNAADYGVPQRRQRVVFVGFRNDLDVDWSFPEPTHSAGALAREQARGTYWDRHGVPRWTRAAPSCEESQLAPWRTVRDALGDLPDPELEPERSRFPTRSARLSRPHRFAARRTRQDAEGGRSWRAGRREHAATDRRKRAIFHREGERAIADVPRRLSAARRVVGGHAATGQRGAGAARRGRRAPCRARPVGRDRRPRPHHADQAGSGAFRAFSLARASSTSSSAFRSTSVTPRPATADSSSGGGRRSPASIAGP